jgi:hypothetical protein
MTTEIKGTRYSGSKRGGRSQGISITAMGCRMGTFLLVDRHGVRRCIRRRAMMEEAGPWRPAELKRNGRPKRGSVDFGNCSGIESESGKWSRTSGD